MTLTIIKFCSSGGVVPFGQLYHNHQSGCIINHRKVHQHIVHCSEGFEKQAWYLHHDLLFDDVCNHGSCSLDKLLKPFDGLFNSFIVIKRLFHKSVIYALTISGTRCYHSI